MVQNRNSNCASWRKLSFFVREFLTTTSQPSARRVLVLDLQRLRELLGPLELHELRLHRCRRHPSPGRRRGERSRASRGVAISGRRCCHRLPQPLCSGASSCRSTRPEGSPGSSQPREPRPARRSRRFDLGRQLEGCPALGDRGHGDLREGGNIDIRKLDGHRHFQLLSDHARICSSNVRISRSPLGQSIQEVSPRRAAGDPLCTGPSPTSPHPMPPKDPSPLPPAPLPGLTTLWWASCKGRRESRKVPSACCNRL